jgi:hypothetical protein
MKTYIKTYELIKYLKYMRDEYEWSEEVKEMRKVVYSSVLYWVYKEVNDHSCRQCGKTIKAGNHSELCSAECEVLYA